MLGDRVQRQIDRLSHVYVVGFIAFLTMSLFACQATTTDNTVDVDGTVAAAVAEALASQSSPVVVDVSATVGAAVEATVTAVNFASNTTVASPEPLPTPMDGDAVPTVTPTLTATSLSPSPAPDHKPSSIITSTPTSVPTSLPTSSVSTLLTSSNGVKDCGALDLTGFANVVDAFYTRCISDNGMLVMASAEVPDSALIEMNRIIALMTTRRPEVVGRLNSLGIAAAVIGVNQTTTDLPQYAHLRSDTLFDWDQTRGLGATIEAPIVSGAEENLLGYTSDPYGAENIFVHEFSHTLFEYGLVSADRRTFNPHTPLPTAYWPGGEQLLADWLAVYDSAIASGRWSDTYAATNWTELWANASQAWFGVLNRPQEYGFEGTREGLAAFEPAIADVFEDVYPAEMLASR